MAGQRARLRDSESELPGITDHPDIDDDCVLHQGRDHKEQDCGIMSLNCQDIDDNHPDIDDDSRVLCTL